MITTVLSTTDCLEDEATSTQSINDTQGNQTKKEKQEGPYRCVRKTVRSAGDYTHTYYESFKKSGIIFVL